MSARMVRLLCKPQWRRSSIHPRHVQFSSIQPSHNPVPYLKKPLMLNPHPYIPPNWPNPVLSKGLAFKKTVGMHVNPVRPTLIFEMAWRGAAFRTCHLSLSTTCLPQREELHLLTCENMQTSASFWPMSSKRSWGILTNLTSSIPILMRGLPTVLGCHSSALSSHFNELVPIGWQEALSMLWSGTLYLSMQDCAHIRCYPRNQTWDGCSQRFSHFAISIFVNDEKNSMSPWSWAVIVDLGLGSEVVDQVNFHWLTKFWDIHSCIQTFDLSCLKVWDPDRIFMIINHTPRSIIPEAALSSRDWDLLHVFLFVPSLPIILSEMIGAPNKCHPSSNSLEYGYEIRLNSSLQWSCSPYDDWVPIDSSIDFHVTRALYTCVANI